MISERFLATIHQNNCIMKIPKVILRIETSRACGRGILLGVSKYCRLFSQWRLTQKMPFYFDSASFSDNPSRPENWMADGMIVARPDIPKAVREIGLPVIGIDVLEPVADMPNIVGDNDSIAEMGLKHFIDRGFSRLAYCEFKGIPWAIERGTKFIAVAKEKGLEIVKYTVGDSTGRFSWDEELNAIGAWLKSMQYPLGIFACNDDCAKLISAACQAANVRCPEEVAILGADNDEMICLPNDPPLSSIVLDFEKAGFEAAGLLDRIMKDQEKSASQRIVLHPTHVETRKSTDVLAVKDNEVAAALQYIRDHADQAIGVPDVVEASSLSRRGLECRFKAVLGKSINRIIRQQRAEKVSKLLIETNLPISQIAYKLGFTDIEHISRFFRSIKQMSPSEFRKQYGRYSIGS